jgi:hypothetical protein
MPIPDNQTPRFQSPLWPYLEEIRSLRRARKTWHAIAEKMAVDHGVKQTLQGVRLFFKRNGQRKELPLGFGTIADLKAEQFLARIKR